MFHTHAPQQRGFFQKTQTGRGCLGFHKEPKGQMLYDLEQGQPIRCHRHREKVPQSRCWQLAAEITCSPRCQVEHSGLPKMHGPPGHHEGLEVVRWVALDLLNELRVGIWVLVEKCIQKPCHLQDLVGNLRRWRISRWSFRDGAGGSSRGSCAGCSS